MVAGSVSKFVLVQATGKQDTPVIATEAVVKTEEVAVVPGVVLKNHLHPSIRTKKEGRHQAARATQLAAARIVTTDLQGTRQRVVTATVIAVEQVGRRQGAG